MNLEQNFPQVSGPFLNAAGAPTEEWLAFFRTLWNRTGGAPGSSTDDAILLAALTGAGTGSDQTARTEAQAAQLLAISPVRQPVDYTEPELFALGLFGQLRASVQAAALSGVTSVTAGTGLTGGGTGAVTLAIATTAVSPGTYGDATHVAQFTVNAEGQLTFAQDVAITASGGGSWFPLVNGAEPPAFITDGAGVLIAVAYAP